MDDCVLLPQWLDDLIFTKLGAHYCRSNCDMTVIDWDKGDVLNYLGTYFPRSYAEAKGIFGEFFGKAKAEWAQHEELSVFDFGCGTGGEIVGLLTVINEALPSVQTVRVHAFDGNQHALRLLETVVEAMKKHVSFEIDLTLMPLKLDDFYDLSLLDGVLKDKYDILMTFKAICEFVTKDQFEKTNPYMHIAKFLMSKQKEGGFTVLVDVTTRNDVSKEWLPVMMDKGIRAANCELAMRNKGYNQQYIISHSKMNRDVSKVAWRIIR